MRLRDQAGSIAAQFEDRRDGADAGLRSGSAIVDGQNVVGVNRLLVTGAGTILGLHGNRID